MTPKLAQIMRMIAVNRLDDARVSIMRMNREAMRYELKKVLDRVQFIIDTLK